MKGNVFTIEAMLGTMLFVLVIAGISSYNESLKQDTFNTADMLLAQDVLIVLDKEGGISSLNSTLISENLETLIGARSDYRLELETYGYSGGSFGNISMVSIGPEISENSQVTSAERRFLSSDDGMIVNYTIARLYLWN